MPRIGQRVNVKGYKIGTVKQKAGFIGPGMWLVRFDGEDFDTPWHGAELEPYDELTEIVKRIEE